MLEWRFIIKILIFYACYGGGHLSAAKSIKQYIDENYSNTETMLVDCMKYINPRLEKVTTGAYNQMAKRAPWAWGKIYKLSQKGIIARISNDSNKIMANKLYKIFEEFKPDIVISTHPFSVQMTAYLKSKGKVNCKLASVMTDFAPHDQWLVGNEYIDNIFVSHSGMKDEITQKNIPSSKIHATGIPLSTKFMQHFDKEKIKSSLNLDINKKTILFFGGGEFGLGKDKTLQIFKNFINNLQDTYQIVAICGKNEKMKHEFENFIAPNVHVYGYSNQVPELMSISDLVVTKPGGLTVTESLASGLPIIIINPIPGQEVENAEFLEKKGVAIWLKNPKNSEILIHNLLYDCEKLKQMKIQSKLLAKKTSTADICKIIIKKTEE